MGVIIVSLALITLGIVEYYFWAHLGVGHVESAFNSTATLFRNPSLSLLFVYLGLFLSKDLRNVVHDDLLARLQHYSDPRVRLGCRIAGGVAVAVTVYVFYTLLPAFSIGSFLDEQKSLGYALIVLPLLANFVLLNAPSKRRSAGGADNTVRFPR